MTTAAWLTDPSPRLTVLSLGAGVQSSTIALMAAEGELPLPDCAIFADTRAEPRPVYEWLDWLIPRLPFPVYRVQWREGLLANVTQPLAPGHGRRASVPAWTLGDDGKPATLRRQCTGSFKIDPINAKIRELLGLRRGQRNPTGQPVVKWLGISLDEIGRVKPDQQPWIETRWPLVFDHPMKRADCLAWMVRHGYPRAPRSACVFCPYRSDREWRDLREADPEGWQTALQVDRKLRGGVRGNSRPLYLHRTLRPLDEVDLSTPQERGQLELWEGHAEECSGACFV